MEIRGRVALVDGWENPVGRAPFVRPYTGPNDEVGRRLERVTGVALLHRSPHSPDRARPWRTLYMEDYVDRWGPTAVMKNTAEKCLYNSPEVIRTKLQTQV